MTVPTNPNDVPQDEPELHDGLWCPDCECEVDNPEPSYECTSCSEVFSRSSSYDGNSHRCPGCMKFSAKYADQACPDCGAELEECTINADGERVEDEGVEDEDA